MNRRVLVVEDEEAHRSLLERVLKKAGFVPVMAADGRQGQEMLKKERVDLVVLDWNMPYMNGGELARWIRKTPQLERLPILMLTVRSKPGQEALGFGSGADDYLNKPYTPKELLARLERLLSLKGGA